MLDLRDVAPGGRGGLLRGTPALASVPCTPRTSPTSRASCSGAARGCGKRSRKTINVVPQVQKITNNGKRLWFSISLAGLYQGPTPINPLRLSATRAAVSGHVYRLLVYGHVTMPDGRSAQTTACAGSGCAGSPPLSVRPTYTYVSQPTNTVRLKDVPCWVGYHELIFTLVNGSLVMNYGGHAICADEGGKRSLTLCAQVVNRINGKNVWFTISGSCVSQTTTKSNLVELVTARTAYTGHGYRVMVSAIVSPGAQGTPTRSATLYSPLGNP